MARLYVVCLPDSIVALPAPDTEDKGTTMAPTRSFIKGHGCPAWIFSTSEELVTGSDDYNYVQRHLCFGSSPKEKICIIWNVCKWLSKMPLLTSNHW